MVKNCLICGMGSIANSWRRAIEIHPEWELIGFIDVDVAKLDNVEAYQLPEENAFLDIMDAKQFCENDVPLIIICTPINSHHQLAIDALDLGYNVICEKNMAQSLDLGKLMVKKAQEHPELCTAVGHQYRYFMKYWSMRKFLLDPDCMIGDVSFIRWASGGNWGFERRGWRRFMEDLYLEDMAPHHFDLLRYFLDMDIVEVQAKAFTPRFSNWLSTSSVIGNFALAKEGHYEEKDEWVYADYYGTWQHRGEGLDDLTVYGEKGNAQLTQWGIKVEEFKDQFGGKIELDHVPLEDNPFGYGYIDQACILEQMHRGIESKGKEQPLLNFEEGFKSFAVSMACRESSRTGKTVWVPDYWEGLYD